MKTIDSTTVVIVPGLRDHVPDHWQTLLAERLREQGWSVRTVQPLQENKQSCAARVAALEQTLEGIDGPIILVAHSVGTLITVHWSQQHKRQIKGALLAAPPDFDTPLPPGYSDPETLQRNGWTPVPRAPLPFPSIVAASRNDHLGTFERVEALAQLWGSRVVDLGRVGHLTPADGFGLWPMAEELICELDAA